MILQVYSILDEKLNDFLPPMFCKDEADCLRTCSQLVNFSDSLMNRFPEDYSVYYIGTFDTSSGTLSQDDAKFESVCKFENLVKDDTKKYTDILKHIEASSGVLDSKQALFDSKLNKIDSLIARAENKVAKLESKQVDIPDFIPPKKVQADDIKSKRTFLDKLFNL